MGETRDSRGDWDREASKADADYQFAKEQEDTPIAWQYEQARAIEWFTPDGQPTNQIGKPNHTGNYCDWGPPQLTFTRMDPSRRDLRNVRPLGPYIPRDLLDEIEEYFDQRADADQEPGDPYPRGNEELTLLTKLRSYRGKPA